MLSYRGYICIIPNYGQAVQATFLPLCDGSGVGKGVDNRKSVGGLRPEMNGGSAPVRHLSRTGRGTRTWPTYPLASVRCYPAALSRVAVAYGRLAGESVVAGAVP